MFMEKKSKFIAKFHVNRDVETRLEPLKRLWLPHKAFYKIIFLSHFFLLLSTEVIRRQNLEALQFS